MEVKNINGYDLKDEISRNKIQSIEENIKDSMVVFGDSWSMPDYPYIDNQNDMWHHIIAQQLNLTLKNYAVSGSGYAVNDNKFNSQVEQAKIDETLDKNKVKYVFIYGGINDLNFGNSTETNYGEDVLECLSNIKNYFSNSQIIVLSCNTQNYIRRGDEHSTISNIDITSVQRNIAAQLGITFINTLLFLYGVSNSIDSGHQHPTRDGQIRLASCILSAMNGNNSMMLQDFFNVDNLDNEYADVLTANLTSEVKGNLLYITFNFKMRVDFTYEAGISFPLKPFTNLPLISSPLISITGEFGGLVRIGDTKEMKVYCNNVKANKDYVATFVVSL